jgi:glycine cleavage system H protein
MIKNNLKKNKMDGFTYSNIFDTKGIEYLAIIGFLILLIPFWIVLNKEVRIAKRIKKAVGTLTASILRIPQGLFYSKNHTWTHLEKSGNANVGLDDLLVHITGEMNFRNLRNPGETIRKGERLAEFEQQNKHLSIFSPISGKIINVNHALVEEPALLNEDPYGKGWLYQIKPSDWKSDTATYRIAEETKDWIRSELDRFKDFLSSSVKEHSDGNSMVVLQDGGELRDHSLSELPGELWQDFQKEFLDPDISRD